MQDQAKVCCTPARDTHSDKPPVTISAKSSASFCPQPTVVVPGGKACVGTNNPVIRIDGEGRVQKKTINAYRMCSTSVTNAAFARFVGETGYVTEAERIGWSFVFHSDVSAEIATTRGVVGTQWWREVRGANWRHIHGPDTADVWEPDHPVVHVSWSDACEFASGRCAFSVGR